MTPVTVTLPLRLTNPSNGGQGRHWAVTARHRSTIRGPVRLVVASRIHGLTLPVFVTITRIAPSSGLDFDGLVASAKSVRDGVADAFGMTDRDPRILWAYGQERGPAKTWAVRVTIAPSTLTATGPEAPDATSGATPAAGGRPGSNGKAEL